MSIESLLHGTVSLNPSRAGRDASRIGDEVIAHLVGLVLERIGELADAIGGALDGFTQVTDDGSVKVLTIHNAKGLEFHTVIVLGVESQTFWSEDEDANRAEFFVAVSRAKQRLLLTVTEEREKPRGAGRWDEIRTPHVEFLSYAET